MAKWQDLPAEAQMLILSLVPSEDHRSAHRVCKAWRSYVNSRILWATARGPCDLEKVFQAFPSVEGLTIKDKLLTDREVAALSAAPLDALLQHLEVPKTVFNDAAAAILAAHATGLRYLNVGRCKRVISKGALLLVDRCPNLETFCMFRTGVRPATAAWIMIRHPRLCIYVPVFGGTQVEGYQCLRDHAFYYFNLKTVHGLLDSACTVSDWLTGFIFAQLIELFRIPAEFKCLAWEQSAEAALKAALSVWYLIMKICVLNSWHGALLWAYGSQCAPQNGALDFNGTLVGIAVSRLSAIASALKPLTARNVRRLVADLAGPPLRILGKLVCFTYSSSRRV
ncbi:hypothetical protein WJX72_000165 [[Myrmecia] bisecta]|uniref:F-box domain-containing protein n=1 Tax=[Myrmecia] bisecta TaxID=41462 RepID=A0AAW1PN54_9CHLO